MTKYDSELRERLLRGDPDVRRWLIETAATDPDYEEEGLTELEEMMWRDLREDYKIWKRRH